MAWNAPNASFMSSPNFAAYGAPNFAAYGGRNFAAHAAPNFAAYAAPNFAAYGAPNFAALGSPNFAALSCMNFAAQPSGGVAGAGGGPPLALGNGTGAGGASGSGFAGGYGPVARFEYATPAALAPLPWILDFSNGDGWPSFPLDLRLDPTQVRWESGDWDPALRFWTLPFDPTLTEWLQDLNLGAPAVMAAREFAGLDKQHQHWLAGLTPESALQTAFESKLQLLEWKGGAKRSVAIQGELEELADLMRDDRMRYLEEAGVQSGSAVPYFVHLMGFDSARKPWTMELMNCASAIGNLVKMQYKSHYRRVRPSFLCPGLTPPWGPPQHPSFPSGHSTVAHLTALFLLSVGGIATRFGVFDARSNVGRVPDLKKDFLNGPDYGTDQRSPLLWLAWRIAKGRERLGLHYRSDSAAGRHLAALLWDGCLGTDDTRQLKFEVPALRSVLARATAEWV